jgi:hypothetical protein
MLVVAHRQCKDLSGMISWGRILERVNRGTKRWMGMATALRPVAVLELGLIILGVGVPVVVVVKQRMW